MAKYKCEPCGYVYDPEKGDPENGIAPGTASGDCRSRQKNFSLFLCFFHCHLFFSCVRIYVTGNTATCKTKTENMN